MLRHRRIVLLLAAVAVAAVVLAALVVIGAGGDGSSSTTTAATTNETATTAEGPLLAGIPQKGLTLGNADAPATLIEFADPQCPYCAEWSNGAFPSVVRDFVRPGRVRLEFRGAHFIGPDSQKALRVVLAASLQNKMWNMLEAVYANQGAENSGWVTNDLMRRLAGDIPGLDADRMLKDAGSAKVTALIRDSDALASELAVEGTPSFYVLRPPANPQLLQLSSLDAAGFSAALAPALAG